MRAFMHACMHAQFHDHRRNKPSAAGVRMVLASNKARLPDSLTAFEVHAGKGLGAVMLHVSCERGKEEGTWRCVAHVRASPYLRRRDDERRASPNQHGRHACGDVKRAPRSRHRACLCMPLVRDGLARGLSLSTLPNPSLFLSLLEAGLARDDPSGNLILVRT